MKSTPKSRLQADAVHSRVLLVAIAFLSYVAIGLPGGVQGVAWPSIQASFGLSLDAIGTLFITHTIGYVLSGYSNGQLVQRLGIGRFMALSSMIGGLGVLGYALAPSWNGVVLCGLLAGVGSGAVDAGMNTYFAINHSPSLMVWLHACFGLGAAVGSTMTTAIVLGSGSSWRWSYVVVAAFLGLTAIGFALTARAWRLNAETSEEPDTAAGRSTSQVRAIDTLRFPMVWLAITMFFVFTGLEASGGQWPYSLFTEARRIEQTTAGLWMSVYWAIFTIGRLLSAIAASRFSIVSLLRVAMLGCVCGTAWIWWNPTDAIGFVGLALLGFSLAPIFPLSISNMTRQIGARHAPNAIGFQVAAASLGIAILPGLGGVLAERLGLEVIGPFLLALAATMLLLHELFIRWGKPGQPVSGSQHNRWRGTDERTRHV
jgi:fucose permease